MTDIVDRLNEANWGRTDTLLTEAADEIERLRDLLERRDEFLVNRGLWDRFVRTLRHSRHGQKDLT